MSDSPFIVLDTKTNVVKLVGELTFATVNEVLAQSQAVFDTLNDLDIDMSDVERSDSAGLALLVHWIRTANTQNKKIVFHNIPSQILSIADASGLDKLIPVQ
jgi:phospholipid transport system transporter-binding protein